MKDKIEDLWNHLFATIEGLLDEDKPLDIERARAVVYVGLVIIEFAKVEVKALETIGSPDGSGNTFPQIGREDSKQVFWNLRHRTPPRQNKEYSAA